MEECGPLEEKASAERIAYRIGIGENFGEKFREQPGLL